MFTERRNEMDDSHYKCKFESRKIDSGYAIFAIDPDGKELKLTEVWDLGTAVEVLRALNETCY
jgi:hypothetical protein